MLSCHVVQDAEFSPPCQLVTFLCLAHQRPPHARELDQHLRAAHAGVLGLVPQRGTQVASLSSGHLQLGALQAKGVVKALTCRADLLWAECLQCRRCAARLARLVGCHLLLGAQNKHQAEVCGGAKICRGRGLEMDLDREVGAT